MGLELEGLVKLVGHTQLSKTRIAMEVCCCSVTNSCPTLCDPVDCSTPGFPVLRCLPEFAHIRVR